MNTERELVLGHGLERAEVRLAGRACERVEAPDPVVHRPHGIAWSDVHLDIAGLRSGHDHVMSSRERSWTTALPMVPAPPTTMMRTRLPSDRRCGAQRCRASSLRPSDVRYSRTAVRVEEPGGY